MLGANSLLKRTSSAPGARNGHLRPATRSIRKMAFLDIFNGVNRHSFCGNRATEVTSSQPSYPRRLGVEATSIIEHERDVETIRQLVVPRLSLIFQEKTHRKKKIFQRNNSPSQIQTHSSQTRLYSSATGPTGCVYLTRTFGFGSANMSV